MERLKLRFWFFRYADVDSLLVSVLVEFFVSLPSGFFGFLKTHNRIAAMPTIPIAIAAMKASGFEPTEGEAVGVGKGVGDAVGVGVGEMVG